MADPTVTVATNHGSFVIALDPAKSPKSVENFLRYVDANHYDQKLIETGLTPAPLGPEALRRFQIAEIAKWTEVGRAAGVRF